MHRAPRHAILAALLILAGPAVAEGGPVALVTAVAGQPSPPVDPFSEIAAGAAISVPDDGRLTFLLYETCERVTVAGGHVAFADGGFQQQGGRVVERKAAPCPRKVTVHGDGTISGVLLRSLGPHGAALKVPTRPAFVFTGKAAKSYATLRIAEGDRTVYEAPLAGPEFTWPAEAPPLAQGAAHTLTLLPARRDGKPLRLDFTAVALGSGGAPPMTVVRLE
jgi:hypothetical protein